MNAYFNYLLEANFGICLFLGLYMLCFRRETDFRLTRVIMLTGILCSILLPLLHLNGANQEALLSNVIPPTWLPEIVFYGDKANSGTEVGINHSVWLSIDMIYIGGVILFLGLFLVRIVMLAKFIYGSLKYRMGRFHIIESPVKSSSFSFFQYIFIGNATELSDEEKKQIIEHEVEHGKKFHSFDILLLHVLSIFFWFNPVIRTYKKIFVQLHEFEADARAVKSFDVNGYCSLLARVALLSADIKLANHFSNSLTLKRIEMMRTSKTKIKRWKLGIILVAFPCLFFVVSCQDQIMNEITDMAKTSTMTIDVPPEVQARLDKLEMANPEKKYIVVIPDNAASGKAEDMMIELNSNFTPLSLDVMKDVADSKGVKRTYVIVEYSEEVKEISERSMSEDEVYMVVEESATFPGGMPALGELIMNNLQYPAEQRMKGIEGAVFVQFIVNKDGSISDHEVIKGVDPALDAEALRVAKLFPNWNPGKQSGKIIRQRFVLPIKFKLN